MGIPMFYRWIAERYPQCVVSAMEDSPAIIHGVTVPVNVSAPNPNGMEFDNLYLDMNGIIHPCFHPEGLPEAQPTTYDEVFKAMFKYIDKIFSIIRPRKLLFMAIDGVAPRAKMNQQRARRFKAAREAEEEGLGSGAFTGSESEVKESDALEQPEMDSNVITPGTVFMELLSSALRYYVHLRMNGDLGWKGLKVILSDAMVPGEGEHKIMSFIRLQRNLPGYDPDTRHCMYGLDADLIMLALATHEVHFSILREDRLRIKSNWKKERYEIRKKEKYEKNKSVSPKDVPKPSDLLGDYILSLKFQILNIWVLREYLRHDMKIMEPAVKEDLERLVDDFVLICLLVGNDFLPNIPTLEISEGAINLLMTVYKDEFVKRGGYLTNSFEVKLERLEKFLHSIGTSEHTIMKERILAKTGTKQQRGTNEPKGKPGKIWSSSKTIEPSGAEEKISPFDHLYRDRKTVTSMLELGDLDCKYIFYAEKFGVRKTEDIEIIKKNAVFKYVEGLCWVMRYYYQEVCSWNWFYPYHYAPFASDFIGIGHSEIQFTLGEPFKPFDQLMGVLPAARKLMTDSTSPISDFYPTGFEVDMEGKQFSWQGIIKLPFIEESRLLSEIAKVEDTLTDEERKRNTSGMDVLFVHASHPLAAEINSIWERHMDRSEMTYTKIKRKIDPALSGGMNGYTYITDKPVGSAEIYSPIAAMKMVVQNNVISVLYKNPRFHSHIPRPLDGVTLPNKVIPEKKIPPLERIWKTKLACMLYGKKTAPVINFINSRSNSKTGVDSCKPRADRRVEAGSIPRREPVVNESSNGHKADSVSNGNVMKLNKCDLPKSDECAPEDITLRLNEENRSRKRSRREAEDGQVISVPLKVEEYKGHIEGELPVGSVAANETINVAESTKSRKRLKKRKHGIDVSPSIDGKILVSVDREPSRSEQNEANINREQHEEVDGGKKTEGKSKKRKRSKEKKITEGDGIAHDNDVPLVTEGGAIADASASLPHETNTEAKSIEKKHKHGSRNKKKQKTNCEPSDAATSLSGIHTEDSESAREHVAAEGLQQVMNSEAPPVKTKNMKETKVQVSEGNISAREHVAADDGLQQEMNSEALPVKRKKTKKTKEIQVQVSEGNQSAREHVVADGLQQEMNSEALPVKRKKRKKTKEIKDQVSEGNQSAREHVAADDGLQQEMNSEAVPVKRKKTKKTKEIEVQVSEGNQSASELVAAVGLRQEMNSEAVPLKKKKTKKMKEIEVQVSELASG